MTFSRPHHKFVAFLVRYAFGAWGTVAFVAMAAVLLAERYNVEVAAARAWPWVFFAAAAASALTLVRRTPHTVAAAGAAMAVAATLRAIAVVQVWLGDPGHASAMVATALWSGVVLIGVAWPYLAAVVGYTKGGRTHGAAHDRPR